MRVPHTGDYPAFLHPIPSPSSDPDESTPTLMPEASAEKPNKGKKRAAPTDDGTSTAAPKKMCPAPAKSKPASTKGKGKARVKNNPPSTSHTGRQPGAQNYSDNDIDTLLHITRDVLPIGGSMWARVTERFNIWARANGRPVRGQKPLKAKFEQVF